MVLVYTQLGIKIEHLTNDQIGSNRVIVLSKTTHYFKNY